MTITYKMADTSAEDQTLTARYASDSNNNATQQDFVLRTVYHVSLTTPSISAKGNTLWAFTNMETVDDDTMQTTVNGNVSFDGFGSDIHYDEQGLTATVAPLLFDGSAATLDNGTCSIARNGNISCTEVAVHNSMVTQFAIAVTPSDANHYVGTFRSSTANVEVIQNIVELPSDASYGITISNGGCTNSDQVRFNVSGYAAGHGDTRTPLVPSDLVLRLDCEKNGDGDSDWDNAYFYWSANSEISDTMSWDGNKFTFTIVPKTSASGYQGCPYDEDKARFFLSLYSYNTTLGIPFPNAIQPTAIKDFEVFSWQGPEITDNNDDGHLDENWDYCVGK